MISSRKVLALALLGMVFVNVGCSNFLWNLQPYRLQRLNRGPAPSIDPEFTLRNRSPQKSLARQTPAIDPPKVIGNSATIAIVRAQSTEW